jgi:alkylation response protein AidB-like acyl-CoA dehydrogenase
MSEMIFDTANRLFADHAKAAFDALPQRQVDGASAWQSELWEAIEDFGFPLALLSEEEGGFGLEPLEALPIIRLVGAHALPIPLAETMLANYLLAAAGLPLASGPAVVVTGVEIVSESTGWRLQGKVREVAWGRAAQTVVVLDDVGRIARIEQGWSTEEGHNLAAEARDTLHFDISLAAEMVATSPVRCEVFEAMGAVMRAQGLAGVLEETLKRCIDYSGERVQFGRPICAFQVIQQNLAELAGQVAAARAGADMAGAALSLVKTQPQHFILLAAAAKMRAGEAAGKAAWVAHQVHGAIGYTREFQLHPLTTRLWAWRDEFGNENYWAEILGETCLAGGAEDFWPLLADRVGGMQ